PAKSLARARRETSRVAHELMRCCKLVACLLERVFFFRASRTSLINRSERFASASIFFSSGEGSGAVLVEGCVGTGSEGVVGALGATGGVEGGGDGAVSPACAAALVARRSTRTKASVVLCIVRCLPRTNCARSNMFLPL